MNGTHKFKIQPIKQIARTTSHADFVVFNLTDNGLNTKFNLSKVNITTVQAEENRITFRKKFIKEQANCNLLTTFSI